MPISSGRLVTSKADRQLLDISFDKNIILLKNFAIWDKRRDISFQIPQKWLNNDTIIKVCRPTIYLKDGKVAFDFAIEFEEPNIHEHPHSLGVDLGVKKPFSAAHIYNNGRYSGEIYESSFTERDSKKINRLERELNLILIKKSRRESLKIKSDKTDKKEQELRAKIRRVKESRDWNIAEDIISEAKQQKSEIKFENLSWSKGGSYGRTERFRHHSIISKTEHKARRRGIRSSKVNPAYTSQICPKCHKKGTLNDKRVFTCENCGWYSDRDYNAALNIAQKNFTSPKGKPTPKRPAKRSLQRRKFIHKKQSWTVYTGTEPLETTGRNISSAISKKAPGFPTEENIPIL